jgi:hypothetical protein
MTHIHVHIFMCVQQGVIIPWEYAHPSIVCL